jgi:hypothetical protein
MDQNRGLFKHHLLWGLWLGLASVACIQILTWVGLGLSNWTWILPWAAVAVFAALATRSLCARRGTRPGFLRIALMVALMVLTANLINQIYMFVYINFVDPSWVDTVADVWAEQLRDAGTSEEGIAERIARFRRQWETRYVFTLGLISYSLPPFLLGVVAGLLTAFLARRGDSTAAA